MQEGGLVTETGLAMLHGTVPQPELVLDNQAASLFMTAANKISMIPIPAEQASGQMLTDMQREQNAMAGVGAPPTIISNNTTTNQVNQSQPLMLGAAPIQVGNPENSRLSSA